MNILNHLNGAQVPGPGCLHVHSGHDLICIYMYVYE